MDNTRNNNSSQSALFKGKVRSKLLPIYIITKDSSGNDILDRKKINFQVNYGKTYHISYKYFMPKGYHLAKNSQPEVTCKYGNNGLTVNSITFTGIKDQSKFTQDQSKKEEPRPIKVTYVDADSNKHLKVGIVTGEYNQNVNVLDQVTPPSKYELCDNQRTNFTIGSHSQTVSLKFRKNAPVKERPISYSKPRDAKPVTNDDSVERKSSESFRNSLKTSSGQSLKVVKSSVKDLESSIQKYNCALSVQLVKSLLNHDLDFFKNVVVEVFSKMKYQDVENLKTNPAEQKVSGVIKKCLYNNNHVNFTFVRAKKYDSNHQVSINEVRDFVTSVMDHHSSKGIFITTSHFSSDAQKEARNHSIILIDDMRLAQLMIQHNVGVIPRRIIRIVNLDKKFF